MNINEIMDIIFSKLEKDSDFDYINALRLNLFLFTNYIH